MAVNIDLNILSCCASDSNIPKMSASVSLGFPNRRKQTKAQGHRLSAFIVFKCLETLMKHEARVFEIIASQPKTKIKK